VSFTIIVKKMSGCVHQVAVREHCSKTVWDRFVLAYTSGVLRVFCSDGFPYVIAPAFPLLHFPLPHFQHPHSITQSLTYLIWWESKLSLRKNSAPIIVQ